MNPSIEIPLKFREKVREALLDARERFSGTDYAFALNYGMNASLFSRLKKGEIDKIIRPSTWLKAARKLNVILKDEKWNIARTEVYEQIENNLLFCKKYNKSMILCDSWGIGKTASARHIASNMKDTFYLDCSQCRRKTAFIRKLAEAIGLNAAGVTYDIKESIKQYLNLLDNPLIILDDVGYLDVTSFIDLIEFWNATEDACAWYMIGDDSLQAKIERGVRNQRVGFGALFSRFSDNFINIVPSGKKNKQDFLIKLVGDVASANLEDKSQVNEMVKKCVGKDKTLRHLKTLIQISKAKKHEPI